jgi:hypothetical protein
MNRRILYFILAFSALNYTKSYGQTMGNVDSLTNKQKDKLYLKQPGAEAAQKFKKSFTAFWNKTFINFTDNSTYLQAGMGFSKQTISAGSYNSNFNYNLSDFNSNVFKPGYYAGFRVDGKYKEKHNYSFGMVLNNLVTGNHYKDSKTLSPFIGSFSNFKADDRFLNLSIAAHYKKLLTITDTSKYVFSLVIGPSLDTRLSEQSADNLVNNNYSRFLLRADVGVEFENKNFYTLFLHYKKGVTSFTKSPIGSNINSLEIGMMIKASDLF